jgi:hypothetical protein
LVWGVMDKTSLYQPMEHELASIHIINHYQILLNSYKLFKEPVGVINITPG